jgi:malate dehydrogenase (oxaloacetate-decarboxylating)(NADP+)
LAYHSNPPGKLEIASTKPMETQEDLSLAYTPGVAEPARDIGEDPEKAYLYTNKGNLVGLVTNGTSVLGLGNLGAIASKPVMEGKAVLMKKFANVDVFDIEVNSEDPQEIINIVEKISPTFGAICLEDIKSPECFVIEEELNKRLSIPVFHDDQHGTAIVVNAALKNALELAGKKIEDVHIVFCGAGAAAAAIAKLGVALGMSKEHIVMIDSKGVIYKGRKENMKPHKEEWAVDTDKRTITEALVDADVFIGVSTAHCVSEGMCKSMAENPIIFALANPDPEIAYDEAAHARGDAIIATGRSDFPNQVNNVLAFPFIFRGALDARATEINDAMKIAAVEALAALAKEPITDQVKEAYGGDDLVYGKEYILPKPLDERLIDWVAPAVVEAAKKSGCSTM